MLKSIFVLVIIFCNLQVFSQNRTIESDFGRLIYRSKEDLIDLLKVKNSETQTCNLLDLLYTDTNNIINYSQIYNDFSTFLKVKKVYKSDQAFIFYFHEHTELRIFLFTSDSVEHSLINLDSIDLAIMERDIFWGFGINNSNLGRSASNSNEGLNITFENNLNIENKLNLISSILFPKKFVPLLFGIKNLIIHPSKNIGLFPFSILKPWGNSGGYLVDSMSTTVNSSICDLMWFWKTKSFRQLPTSAVSVIKNPLVVGDPTTSNRNLGFPPLMGARTEALKVHELIGGTCLIGKKAKVKTVEKCMKSNPDFIYFACHAYSDNENPIDGSFLALSPNRQNPLGILTGRMIQEKKLNAELAVLSGCQTGYGTSLRAGYMGLGRAFYTAGVKNVVSTLWSIDDQATLSLMLFFIEELQKPHLYFPAEPLRQAILKQKALTPEPKYWAPFMVFGIGNL